MTRLSDVVTVAQAAALKGVPPDTVRRRIKRQKLPAIRMGREWLIKKKDLEAWTVQRRKGKR
jgi:excisionase family DNA binding protein